MAKLFLKEFREKLEALEAEYGYEIGGCGCCGSPWIQDKSGEMHNLRSNELVEITITPKHRNSTTPTPVENENPTFKLESPNDPTEF